MATPDKVHDILDSLVVKRDKNSSSGSPGNVEGPFGKAAFFRRVATYTSLTWSAKPSDANPLECARVGWFNADMDILRCCGCEAVLCAQLAPASEIQLYQESCRRLIHNIHSGHHRLCHWPLNPNPKSWVDVHSWDRVEAIDQLVTRSKNIESLASSLPYLLDPFRTQIETLLAPLQQLLEGKVQLSLPMAQVTLRGWMKSMRSAPKMLQLSCQHCVREVGLWNYDRYQEASPPANESQMPDIPEADSTTDEKDAEAPPPPKKPKLLPLRAFSPIQEHRPWCPWITETNGTAGWQSFLEALSNRSSTHAKENGSPPKMAADPATRYRQLRKIRTLLDDCSSPVCPPQEAQDSVN